VEFYFYIVYLKNQINLSICKNMTRFNLDCFDTIILFFSWYVKPILQDQTSFITIQVIILCFLLLLYNFTWQLFWSILNPLFNLITTIKLSSYLSIWMGLKFILLLGLLILIRGGIPRYRYDFLTKLGWIKTLSLALTIFLINLLLSYL
jgi:hypothetical protein